MVVWSCFHTLATKRLAPFILSMNASTSGAPVVSPPVDNPQTPSAMSPSSNRTATVGRESDPRSSSQKMIASSPFSCSTTELNVHRTSKSTCLDVSEGKTTAIDSLPVRRSADAVACSHAPTNGVGVAEGLSVCSGVGVTVGVFVGSGEGVAAWLVAWALSRAATCASTVASMSTGGSLAAGESLPHAAVKRADAASADRRIVRIMRVLRVMSVGSLGVRCGCYVLVGGLSRWGLAWPSGGRAELALEGLHSRRQCLLFLLCLLESVQELDDDFDSCEVDAEVAHEAADALHALDFAA